MVGFKNVLLLNCFPPCQSLKKRGDVANLEQRSTGGSPLYAFRLQGFFLEVTVCTCEATKTLLQIPQGKHSAAKSASNDSEASERQWAVSGSATRGDVG